MVCALPRGLTASVDAYLTPVIKEYLSGFISRFDEGLGKINVFNQMEDLHLKVDFLVTKQSLLETQISGAIIQAPQLDINTVVTGGGSKLKFQFGAFRVGPDSVGAHPAPVCYCKESELAVTDANLILGTVIPDNFPSIFGPNEDQHLDVEATRNEFEKLSHKINSYRKGQDPLAKDMSVEEIALGFVNVANETMCRPIRQLTEMKGRETRNRALACFGGTDTAIVVKRQNEDLMGNDYAVEFVREFQLEYGFKLQNRNILICDVRVRGIGVTNILKPREVEPVSDAPKVERTYKIYFDDGWHKTPLFKHENLGYGLTLPGPAIIMNGNSTVIVEPDCKAAITKFMGIAEQMGRTLQRTWVSTNIKERLDFSCALFGPDGGLIANAPHVPVHLGAMSSTVRWQLKHWGNNLNEGDVLVTNHPCAGGVGRVLVGMEPAVTLKIFEQRYPVLLYKFGLWENSGGYGLHKGRDGLIREIEFRRPIVVSVLPERRVLAPRGLKGGENGARGVNYLITKDKPCVYLGGKNTVEVQADGILQILTPGYGEWGFPP
ncbi:hypothetical protein GIB67_029464 [Kingdonia uniflora]|uniref:5-oxoprolinase n=1 Tax=Kingdonia uniflora TaxID=39325 RepID=A0A7J7NXW7_9MAGN|nr:hypothetical protein GIB67_029464 [Kingdonia uniflora]